jgi:C1A family cysteine protease
MDVMAILITVLLACLMASPVAASRPLADSAMAERHERWMAEHGRVYKDDDEKQLRLKIFEANLKIIEASNNSNKTYRLKANRFADLTVEEFVAKHTGSKNLHGEDGEDGIAPQRFGHVDEMDDVPPSMDWRENGAVTGVKDQGECGESIP